mmetsp:Transcript_29202/g.68458  ORF Transcript_29202/g.68458 Transcript_29202/m.68458 type:complete len:263 (-) Transcript_29202:128-916(-)
MGKRWSSLLHATPDWVARLPVRRASAPMTRVSPLDVVSEGPIYRLAPLAPLTATGVSTRVSPPISNDSGDDSSSSGDRERVFVEKQGAERGRSRRVAACALTAAVATHRRAAALAARTSAVRGRAAHCARARDLVAARSLAGHVRGLAKQVQEELGAERARVFGLGALEGLGAERAHVWGFGALEGLIAERVARVGGLDALRGLAPRDGARCGQSTCPTRGTRRGQFGCARHGRARRAARLARQGGAPACSRRNLPPLRPRR